MIERAIPVSGAMAVSSGVAWIRARRTDKQP